jgi:DNA polymerase-1
MEREGIRVEAAALNDFAAQLAKEMDQQEKTIWRLGGREFNVSSPRQLGEILFEVLKISDAPKKTRTGQYATDEQTLLTLAPDHEIVQRLLEHRAASKLKSTYADALPTAIRPETGRVHTTYNQVVTATGRLNSQDPNLQNIPIRTETGREIRRAIIAEPGHVLISADYSQIEFRVLAHLADDPVLVDAFREGADFHERTALKIFGSDSGRDPHDLRSTAKMVNYALLYGKTAFTLAKDIGVTPQVAQEFIDAYFAGFPRVRAFIDKTLEDARTTGVVKTLYGRRRLVPELNSRNVQIRQAAEREAVNMPIQGTAADILKLAMIDTHAALAFVPTARMILTVHDELLFEVAADRAEETAAIVQDRMQNAVHLTVPLTVDVGIGSNWADAKS